MNDRFKFRVYNKRLQKMYDVRSMSEYQGSIVRIEVDDYDENNEYKHLIFDDYEKMIDDCILLQCTGLKDRNNLTLLFEGDIINVNGEKIGNIYENENLFKNSTNFVIKRMGTKEWRSSESEAIKRGCKYAE